MLQPQSSSSAAGPPVRDAAFAAPVVPVVPVAPRRNNSLFSLPVLAALCCLGLILFLIAATIVLSLIPIYLQRRDLAAGSQTANLLLPVPAGPSLPVGPFNANQNAALQNDLQRQFNSQPGSNGGTVTVNSAQGVNNGRRKRQASSNFIAAIITITRSNRRKVRLFVNLLNGRPISLNLLLLLISLATNNPTTTTTVATNASRVLVRRSLEEAGAKAGIVYIDSHQMVASKGIVNTVSFYADRTCALTTVEFAAFDLLDRNTDTNEAQLRLTHRSGPLKLGATTDLKPYMNLITIELCDPNAANTPTSGACKGTKFPVAAHQYIGVRSDKCRLGFAPTPSNRILATTWKPQDVSDPFAEPFETIKYVPSDYTVLHSLTIEPATTETSRQSIKQDQSRVANSPRVLFVGSYPPRRCGLAKFLEDLTDVYPGPHSVVAVDEAGADLAVRNYSEKVIFRLNQTDRDAYFALADLVNTGAYDVLNIQHEYALYGGMLSEYVVSLLSSVKKPIISTFHTVIPDPNPFVISVTRAVCSLSTRVVVLASLGRRILVDVYGIDESKIVVIPHGVPDIPFDHSLADNKAKLGLDPNAPTMTTFGLIHRNKNIQLAIKAMETIVKSVPNITYLVIGQTHPIVQKTEGETYRRELEDSVSALGLTKNVRFVDKFVDNSELLAYLGASDIFLTPYAREDQYVSGTLSWAVGLGKVVVSTPYLYAKELLADGRGFLVPFEDDAFMGSLISDVVQDETLRNGAREQAYKFGRRMTWPHVAKDLEQLFREELLFT